MDVLIPQLISLGLSSEEAQGVIAQLDTVKANFERSEWWRQIITKIAHLPFSVHLFLYKTIFPDWQKIPAPAWFPEQNDVEQTHIYHLMHKQGISRYDEFHHWSAHSSLEFWQTMVQQLHVLFDHPYHAVLDIEQGVEQPKWFVGGSMNIVRSCFQADDSHAAIVSQNDRAEMKSISYFDLNLLSNQVANGLQHYLKKGDKVAIIMPMTIEAVAIYLGVIKSGCVAVSIPESFSAEEIATRLRIAHVKMVFCQDHIFRDGKKFPSYEKMIAANAPFIVVLGNSTITLRDHDLPWKNFLDHNNNFAAVSCAPHDYINILFSSGTTGQPKAIPWTHTSPIKGASDAYLHHDLKPGDIFCWPSGLGWMMGPWLIFACLINKATMALYDGVPNGRQFGTFIQDAHITHLGVVPTLVKSWRNAQCMEGLDWSAIKLFTSTGERSNPEDMLYLMHLANYRPVIEYCGGTEISGAYITGTLVQPAAPGAFTTPALGLDFVIVDEDGLLSDKGEVALIPPSLGLSTELLNKDHHEVYYANMPKLADSRTLRRHGDQIEHFANGFYRLLGRVDDTMKLSGIKISSAEIETLLNALEGVYETAAVAINPEEGGPSQLYIYTVLKPETKISATELKSLMQEKIKTQLNPLFKIHEVIVIDALPRTASNKVMRRMLRDR